MMENWKNGVLKTGVRASSPVLVQARTPAHQYGEQSFPIFPNIPPCLSGVALAWIEVIDI